MAVFNSWENDRANAYRKLNNIPASWGTAVNVQAMVFGNKGDDSATGVCFTRNPASGENEFYGEFLVNAQGEDVVAGIRTPQKIVELGKNFPKAYQQLLDIRKKLEKHYKDMQDIEFTIENSKLFMLQCRNGKRTGFASVRIAVEMVEEKLIPKEEALRRVEPEALNQLLRPVFEAAAKQSAVKEGRLLAKGLPAGPGAATGRIVFFAEDAEAWAARGEKTILCRHETSPEDIRGMNASEGFLTAFGGMTSHAALVARQMGKVCIVGCDAVSFDYHNRTMSVNTARGPVVLREGDWISIDGFAGEVMNGRVDTTPSEVIRVLIEKNLDPNDAPAYQRYARLLGWADKIRRLHVRANADQPDQATAAVAFGAEGIGLCRTEHMFFGEGKIGPMREMIVAENEAARRKALEKLLPLQREDFAGIFRAMGKRPVTIRTLDPPLHEFLPHDEAGVLELARATGKSVAAIEARINDLKESNPMLGHRGCRLGISYPEITEMQARAVFEAACDVAAEGTVVEPEIMIPLVGSKKEIDHQAAIVRSVAAEVFKERGRKLKYLVGTMIEVPRAALTAGAIAETAEFFSFGTNDLTQTTFGLSRDDVPKVLAYYVAKDIYDVDPFVSLDRDGVGQLMRMAVASGRKTRSEYQDRHLRRAWRRSKLGHAVRRVGAQLRFLFALSPAHRAPGGGPSRAQEIVIRRPSPGIETSSRYDLPTGDTSMRFPVGRVPVWCLSLLSALALAGAGCGLGQTGIDPPMDQIFWPAGLAIDPIDGNWLYVVNSNNDLRFNAGTLIAIDLQKARRDASRPVRVVSVHHDPFHRRYGRGNPGRHFGPFLLL